MHLLSYNFFHYSKSIHVTYTNFLEFATGSKSDIVKQGKCTEEDRFIGNFKRVKQISKF